MDAHVVLAGGLTLAYGIMLSIGIVVIRRYLVDISNSITKEIKNNLEVVSAKLEGIQSHCVTVHEAVDKRLNDSQIEKRDIRAKLQTHGHRGLMGDDSDVTGG